MLLLALSTIVLFAAFIYFYRYKNTKDLTFDLVTANKALDANMQLHERDISYLSESKVYKEVKAKLQHTELNSGVKLTYAISCFLEFLVKEQKYGGMVAEQQVKLAKHLSFLISQHCKSIDKLELTIFDNNVLNRTLNIVKEFDRCFQGS